MYNCIYIEKGAMFSIEGERMESPHHKKERPVLVRYVAVLALVFLVSVSLLLIISPACVCEKPVGRGQDYEVILVSDEKDPDTGNTIPLVHTIEPGKTTSYKFSVWNIGTFPDTYDLSPQGVPAYWNAVLSMDQVTINGNTSQQLYLNVTPPYQGVSPGQEAVITINALSTTDPTNSTAALDATTKLSVVTGFDLGLSITKDHVETDLEDLNNEIILYPGETTALGVNVLNQANVHDSFYLNVTQNDDWDVFFSNYQDNYDLDIPASTVSEEPGKLMLQVTAPSDASKGHINYVTVNCDSKYNEDNEVIPSHKSKTVKVIVDYVSYLLVESSKDSMVMEPNETVSADITVTNIGMLDITYSTPINEIVENGGSWYVIYPDGENTNLLEPGDTMTFPVEITAPLNAAGGLEQVFNIKGRTNDDAIFLPAKITCSVKTIYDLSVIMDPSAMTISPDSMKEFTLEIQNTGNSNISVDVFVSDSPSDWTITLDTQHFYLNPDGKVVIGGRMETTSGTGVGDYDVIIRFKETREGLDILDHLTVVRVEDFPDLAITETDINISNLNPKDKETVTITFTVHNHGTLEATDIYVKVVQVTASGSRPLIHEETIPSIMPGESHSIEISWQAAVSADSIEVEIDPNLEITESWEDNNIASKKLFVPNPYDREASTGEGRNMGVKEIVAIIAATALVTIAAVFIIMKVGGKELTSILGIGSGLFAPLYSKLRHDNILNNEIREDIYDFILENPGSHFRSILTELSLSNGTLSHHLNTLEREDFIKSEKDGPLRRYYPKGRRLVGEVYDLNDVQKKIMANVAKNPGITQKELAKAVGVSQPTAHYHLTALRNARLVELRREGKNQKCYIVRRVS
jgi:predicted transcriptional regulator/uncharacterized membrane protein